MAIEAVGNVTMGNVASYQTATPRAVEHVSEPVKVEAVKPQPTESVSMEVARGNGNDFSAANDTLRTQNEMSQEKMHKALDNINKKLSSTSCEYGYDETTNRVTIKIIDKETDKVIRELPPEKTLAMIAKAWELAGILVDERL